MTGGHGEWFVQCFDAAGQPAGDLASCKPADAAGRIDETLVAGSQAQAFVDLRGHGEALMLLPDANHFASLPAAALSGDVRPHYGRAPDARLPAIAT